MNFKVCLTSSLWAFLSASVIFGQQPSPTPAAVPAAGAAKKETLEDKPVLKVGDQSVMRSEMDLLLRNLNPQARRTMATQGTRAMADNYATMLALAQEGASKHLDDSADYRRAMAAQRSNWLAQAEYREIEGQLNVTPEETSKYYSDHAADYDQIQIRQIMVRTKPEGAKEGTPGLTLDEAKTRMEAIKKALASGTDAKKVTQDFGVANQVMVDADPRPLRRSPGLSDFQKNAFALKDGEFTEAQSMGGSLAMIQVVSHGKVELKDVQMEIENALKQQKINDQIQELKKRASVWIDEDYFKPPTPPPSTPSPAPVASNPLPKQ